MKFIKQHSYIENIISFIILVIDIYILGEFNLFKPIYFAPLFIIFNLLWFCKYFKMNN